MRIKTHENKNCPENNSSEKEDKEKKEGTVPVLEYIKWFKDISLADVSLVGGKNAALGELIRALSDQGIRIPNGFAITTNAWQAFLQENRLSRKIDSLLESLVIDDLESLSQCGREIRHLILSAEFPEILLQAIHDAYARICMEYFENADLAVRSSATAEDLPEASFAGQLGTYLNVRGMDALADACRECYASLYTDRAISYRIHKRIAHQQVSIAIVIQKMVRADLAAAGVMFSIDTETGFRNAVLINSAYGLGESIVQGIVNPDEFYVFKSTLQMGYRPIIKKKAGNKENKTVYDLEGSKMIRTDPVPINERRRFSIDDDDVLQLARWACLIENHFSDYYGRFTPMDIEWAKDGQSSELFILQARPETVQSQKNADSYEQYSLSSRSEVLVRGSSVGEKIRSGRVVVIRKKEDLVAVKKGDVLVSDSTAPDWEPVMKLAAAVVTDRGGRTCHAAIVSRELGVPAVVGTGNATAVLKDGQQVTVSCAEGDIGVVYQGLLPIKKETVDVSVIAQLRIPIMLNLANSQSAFRMSFLPNSGVGLARTEFIINHAIGIHPLALVKYNELKDQSVVSKIEALTDGYDDKKSFFVDKLAENIAMIAAAFHPKEVIVRMSDFKTNEYAQLLGGSEFEPNEENPMIGFRGASRYYSEQYRQGFALECLAMKRVRDEMGLYNLNLMIPFCRTVEEGQKVLQEMRLHGLRQGDDGLKIYAMCEVPSNVLLARQFLEIFDGFSIGSNDLTQLILGIDRDSSILSNLFDERNEAVLSAIRSVVYEANTMGKKIGFCGQAPSDYPEYADFLIDAGIDSISLNPDAVLKMIHRLSRGTGDQVR